VRDPDPSRGARQEAGLTLTRVCDFGQDAPMNRSLVVVALALGISAGCAEAAAGMATTCDTGLEARVE